MSKLFNTLLQSAEHRGPVLGLAPLKPDLSRGLGERGLERAKEAAMLLTRLQYKLDVRP